MSRSLAKVYQPHEVEREVQALWEGARAFHTVPDPSRPADQRYVIVIPPPNVTAALHLGHALNNTLQDILIRYHRMLGHNTEWMPGTDHAGITTQTVVDKRLKAAGEPALADYKKMELAGGGGREKFIAKVQAWKDEYERRITDQLRAMGCSCDYERQRFTMDPVCAAAVREAFFRLFKAGLIYRGKRLVNWDPATQTALADDEVEMREIDGHFWYMKYPIVDDAGRDTGEFTTVATTRPETMLGDTAVAVNPSDPERAALIGRRVRLPIVNRIIPIIGDDYVVVPAPSGGGDTKAEYTSGFLKVTPAHDPNDWEIGRRHNLPVINVMAPDGTISRDHGWPEREWNKDTGGTGFQPVVDGFAHTLLGLDRYEAREAIVDWFRVNGLLAEVKPYTHSVGHSYRSHVPIEPYLSDQWYVRVTDDRLAGAALDAMAPDQRDASDGAAWRTGDSVARASRPCPSVTADLRKRRRTLPHWEMGGSTYFVTFRVLQGELNPDERRLVMDACLHWHGDRMEVHLVTVMPDHVHLLVTPLKKSDGAWYSLEELLHSIKSFTSHELNKRRGASGTVWQDEYFDRIIRDEEEFEEKWNYICLNPVKAGLAEEVAGYPFTWSPGWNEESHGRDARATDWEGSLRFHPARYARTFQAWHEGIRDWCISRQLWWGHRIPVWSADAKLPSPGNPTFPDYSVEDEEYRAELNYRLECFGNTLGLSGQYFCVAYWDESDFRVFICARTEQAAVEFEKIAGISRMHARWHTPGQPLAGNVMPSFSSREATLAAFSVQEMIADAVQDPDVLDTWFSSALWPISTMGWPDPRKFPEEIPEGEALLEAWNPSSTLCTAREIITLWVSRMVMFNLFFRGCLPFRDVFIHAMIQDGEGQKMSKSLGNGVDPLDIIHSHGADAMRFTLAKLTTQTQDVRMPVDVVCPHTGQTFAPRTIRTAAGHIVAAPIQQCPTDPSKKMVTGYGLASGEATPTDRMPLARNTSSKFDEGRNLANKLWNAGRFVLSTLADEAGGQAHTEDSPSPREFRGRGFRGRGLADRWVLSRLADTWTRVNEALAGYRFNEYAQQLYDFFWRDYCDWYLEAVKPAVKGDHGPEARNASMRTLAACFDAVLRMLHPAMPYVTEKLWGRLNDVAPQRSIEGVDLPPSDLLIASRWPKLEPADLSDAEAERRFELLREVVGAIRNVRNQYGVPPRQTVTVHLRAPEATAGELRDAAGLIETLAMCDVAAVGSDVEPAADSAAAVVGDVELFIEGLVDREAERRRLGRRVEELGRDIRALEGRLANRGYIEKAPAHLVQQTREELAEKRREFETVEQKLAALAG